MSESVSISHASIHSKLCNKRNKRYKEYSSSSLFVLSPLCVFCSVHLFFLSGICVSESVSISHASIHSKLCNKWNKIYEEFSSSSLFVLSPLCVFCSVRLFFFYFFLSGIWVSESVSMWRSTNYQQDDYNLHITNEVAKLSRAGYNSYYNPINSLCDILVVIIQQFLQLNYAFNHIHCVFDHIVKMLMVGFRVIVGFWCLGHGGYRFWCVGNIWVLSL